MSNHLEFGNIIADFSATESVIELVGRPTNCGLRDFNRDARHTGAQFRRSYQPGETEASPSCRYTVLSGPRRDSLSTIYRRLMKCLVLGLRAVGRSVFTIPLINWLTRPVRPAPIDIQDVSRETWTRGRNSIPEGISSQLFRTEYFIRRFRIFQR